MRSLACLIGATSLLCLPLSNHAQQSSFLSAWDILLEENPSLMDKVADLELEVLQLMTESQFQAFLQGADASEIILATGETLEMFLSGNGGGTFDLSWYSFDGGGGSISGGNFTLTGSVGQPDAGVLIGGEFAITSGFLSIGPPQTTHFPCQTEDDIFCDGFESGDLTEWSTFLDGV